ncbi:hypothetical protein, partial [Bremerella cremea]|uniref:hypothetical protein n=1 Tax=Bremerella cremea TaxID=1031537 RepID=UPI0031F0EB9E
FLQPASWPPKAQPPSFSNRGHYQIVKDRFECFHTRKSVLLLSLRAMLPNWEERNVPDQDRASTGSVISMTEFRGKSRLTRENTGEMILKIFPGNVSEGPFGFSIGRLRE